MKKLFVILAILLIMLFSGCAADASEEVHEITERFFAMQMFELFVEPEEFMGRTIRYEGLFATRTWTTTGEDFHMVYRYTAGCCEPMPEPLGLEIYLNDIDPVPEGAWVEITGILERFEVEGTGFLRLSAISMVEKDERGMELVAGLN